MIEQIQKFLFEKDQMFHYEFSLFNNFLPYFNSDFIILMMPTTIKYLQTINTKYEYFIENVKYYNNLSTYFYMKRDYNMLEYTYNLQQILVENKREDLPLNEFYKIKFFYYILNSKDLNILFKEMESLELYSLMTEIKKL